MAFLRTANATLVKPAISMPAWDEVRSHATVLGSAFDHRNATKAIVQKYQPDQYMLSHCTIIASVDAEDTRLPIGRQMVDGFQIDRRYSDFQVSPKTAKYINNNNDCWERRLLLACFRTFVGGENYVEHLQVPELSKGKIIDAAARDIGDSVYVDILVATNLVHQPLIHAIRTGQLQTLSMGCQVQFTICTKCGNVAEDETQLCSHVRYMKGNTYLDGLGKPRKIAELCGHINAEPGSVKFIEASWVANPAFTGAVLRNILTPQEIKNLGPMMQLAFSQPARTAEAGMIQKAARAIFGDTSKMGFGEGQDTAQFEGAPETETPKKDDPLDKAIGDLADYLQEKAVEKVRKQIGDGDSASLNHLNENKNESLIKEAVRRSPEWQRIAQVVRAKTPDAATAGRLMLALLIYKNGGWKAVQASERFSGVDILALSRLLDVFSGTVKTAGETRIYRTVLAVGGVTAYGDVDSYLAACRRVLGRDLMGSERDALVTKGRLYDLGS
jgi:hypothetical protein